MENNIKNTKNKLSIIFSIIIFIIILILWTSFFSVKYFNEYKREVNNFKLLSVIIKSWKIDKIKIIWDKFEENFSKKFKREKRKKIANNLPNHIVNYVHLDGSNSLVSKFIKEDIEIEFFKKVLKSNKYFKTTYEKWFLIKKFDLKNNEKFVIFEKLKYDLDDYFEDIFKFFIISLLFSIFIYFISRKFINNTFVPVEQNIDDMKNFIHNAGHELKTPISVIDSNLQILDDTKKFDKSMNKEMRYEVKKLNSLIDCLVNLSDVGSFKNKDKNILKDILEEIIKEFKDKIKEKELKINLDIKDDIIVEANRNYLYMFLSNLIWNAIKYNNDKWVIDIYYRNRNFIIKDTWIWIAKKDLNKIFDRFYKIDKSRNSEGFGIWLSLVKKIAWVYRWKIEVKSEKWKGSEFRVYF